MHQSIDEGTIIIIIVFAEQLTIITVRKGAGLNAACAPVSRINQIAGLARNKTRLARARARANGAISNNRFAVA